MTREVEYFQDGKTLSEEERAAIEWHMQLLRGDASAHLEKEFEAWLEASPENTKVYEALVRLWDKVETVADGELKRAAPAPDGADRERAPAPARVRPFGRTWRTMGGAMALVLLVMLFVQLPFNGATYETALGEQREFELADGSVLTLNTASSAEVRLRKGVRLVRLLDGQASFSVAHDEGRPFIVFAADSAVMAVGTEFDVFKSGDEVRVTLIEGAVDVAAGLSERRAVRDLPAKERSPDLKVAELVPGDQIFIDAGDGSMSPAAKADIDRLMAWREGKVSFRNTPLKEAVAEINRYSAVKIRLEGEELGELLVSGTFGIHNADSFTSAVETLFGLDSRRQGRSIVLTRKEAA
ncbi:FecR family protein [Hyphococcus luteus]|uniref:Iron dicitrate transport regulator FecR n=1 Tax=Hyphococcus luteus TaxID=2058213 RepID=A0A2S7K3U9_9PROT|nr:FecR domain-containing protein [Marinicaulis flavus]PQA87175.1 hypothetical protein CW354_14140 [Marinicaulis flavus]